MLPSHISPEQSRLATFPAALEASEGHFDPTVYCFCFFSDFYYVAPFFSGGQCFQLLWMPKMFAGCSWHLKPTVYCQWLKILSHLFSLPPFSLAGNISSCLKCQKCFEWVAAVDISSPLLFVDKIVYAKLVSSLLPPFSQAGNIASYLRCLWASGLLLIFDNIIYGKFYIWSFLFHCLLFRRLATIPAALNIYDQ